MLVNVVLLPVQSSAIDAIGYDLPTKTMRVQFANGRVHDFPDTEENEHVSLVKAESIGRHFNKHIRGRKHTRIS